MAERVDETDRQSISDVLPTCYEKLYKDPHRVAITGNTHLQSHDDSTIPPFTASELHQAIKELKNGMCSVTAGLTADLLKAGGATLQCHLLRLYNDTIKPDRPPSDQ
eukprot:9261234-Pyramimonas_sp.AAC.1